MSTATLEPETKPRLSPEAIAVIRQYVEAGCPYSDAVADATGLIRAEYGLIQERFEKRQAASITLTVEVPRREAEADEAERIAREAEAPLGDNVTLGEVRAKVDALVPNTRVSSHAEWSEAFGILYRHGHELLEKAQRARGLADALRNRCERTLLETSHVEPSSELQTLSLRRETLEKKIAEAREVVRSADEDVPRQRALVEAIGRGEVVPPMCRQYGLPRTGEIEREYFREKREELRQSAARATGKPAAIAVIEAAERELAELQPKLSAAANAQRERMLQPSNMNWSVE